MMIINNKDIASRNEFKISSRGILVRVKRNIQATSVDFADLVL